MNLIRGSNITLQLTLSALIIGIAIAPLISQQGYAMSEVFLEIYKFNKKNVSELSQLNNNILRTVIVNDNLYELEFESHPSDGGEIFCNGKNVSNVIENYPPNTAVNCEAVASNGYTFDSWKGLLSTSENPYLFQVSSNGSLVAYFRDSWYKQVGNFFSHPFLILLAGAGISGYLIPYFTKRWQERQKDLEYKKAHDQKEIDIKVKLVDDINNSTTDIVLGIIFELAGIRSQVEGNSRTITPSTILEKYRQWEIKRESITSRLWAYFPDSDRGEKIGQRWYGYSEIINVFFEFALDPAPERRFERWQKIQAYFALLNDYSIDNVNWRNPSADDWKRLAENILRQKDPIIKYIFQKSITTF